MADGESQDAADAEATVAEATVAEATVAEATVRMLRRQLRVLHAIDEIRDRHQHQDLKDLLPECLRFLTCEINATSAFVAYTDAYSRQQVVVVDAVGLLKDEEQGIVAQLFDAVRQSGEAVRADPRIFGGNYLALPMRIEGEFVGIIGAGKSRESAPPSSPHAGTFGPGSPPHSGALNAADTKQNAQEVSHRPGPPAVGCDLKPNPDHEVSAEDETLIAEAGSVLDTAIRKRLRDEVDRDELRLVEDLDRIIDQESNNLEVCTTKMLTLLVQRLGAKAAVVCPGKPGSPLIGSEANGRILWETNQGMQIQIKLLAQQADRGTDAIFKHFADDAPDRMLAGRAIRSLAAQPLVTAGGQRAGTLVVASHHPLGDGHARLVRRAGTLLDTAIVTVRHTEKMVRRYNKYLGTKNLQLLIADPEFLDPRQETVAILSADIVGSTGYSHAEPDPLVVFHHINQYLRLMGTIVKNEFEGTLDKYIGDEVIGLFGAPVPDASRAANALGCARRILTRVREMNQSRSAKGEPVFDVKVAVGLARCIAGEVGSPDTQTDYTVIGRDVNQFFRITRHAEAGKIIVNEALYEELKEQYSFEFVEALSAKGVDRQLPIYRLREGPSASAVPHA